MTAEQFQPHGQRAVRVARSLGNLLRYARPAPAESSDARAAEALALFCYQAKKWIGALAAHWAPRHAGLCRRIGENAAVLRERICEGLGFLGINLELARNAANAPVITTDRSQATVRIIRTDEEFYIATAAAKVLSRAGAAAGTSSS